MAPMQEPSSAEYATAGLYIILAIICLLGNTWVIVTVLKQFCGCLPAYLPYIHTPKPAIYSASVYLLLLSLVDLVSIFPVPVLVIDILYNRYPFDADVFGKFICRFIYFCEGANKSLSPLVLTVLSFDRYVAVCKPNWVCIRRPKIAFGMAILCCIFSLGYVVPVTIAAEIGPMVDAKNRSRSKCYVNELSLTWVFDSIHVFGCFLMPLCFICAVYAAILYRLYRHTRTSSVGKKTSIPLHRVVRCSAAVVGFYFVCWTPYWTMRLNFVLEDLQSSPNTTSGNSGNQTIAYEDEPPPPNKIQMFKVWSLYLFHALPYAQSAFNWLFYAFLNRNLRHSSSRPSAIGRSIGVTSALIDHQNTASPNGSMMPSWRNQKNATGNNCFALKKTHFRLRPQIGSRSTTPAGEPNGVLQHENGSAALNRSCSSMVDFPNPEMVPSEKLQLPRKSAPSALRRNSPGGLTESIAPLLQPEPHCEAKRRSGLSESSAVEWL